MGWRYPASPKSQFKKADASGARFALVFGSDEVARGEVAVKPLREGGEQVLRPLANVADWAGTLQARRPGPNPGVPGPLGRIWSLLGSL